MPRYVALLRAVNVGGFKVSMADLRETAEGLGWSDVSTHLNSGNLLFTTSEKAAKAGERLEGALADRYGKPVPALVRTPAELADVLERLPFRGKRYSKGRIQVAFLSSKPKGDARKRADAFDAEEVVVDGREAFIHYPDGVGRSKLTTAALEKALGVTATLRGPKTVAGLVERA
jgi:uncharacterized protein (DUF1697 family)